MKSDIRTRSSQLSGSILIVATLLCALATAAAAQQPPPGTEEPGLGDLVRLYETERSYVSRFYSVAWSEQRFDRLAQVYADWEKRLAALDFEKLTTAGRTDYVLFRTELATNRSRLELDRRRLVEMSPILPGREVIQSLELARRREHAPATIQDVATLREFGPHANPRLQIPLQFHLRAHLQLHHPRKQTAKQQCHRKDRDEPDLR